ncbi:MAG TPA: hypothetical protein VFN67_30275 [Polyangiales bacterium]|nr:hypothetical protein [Polyangiales bacterium]
MDQSRVLSISQPLLQVNDSVARLSVIVRFPEGPKELWFTLPAQHADKLSAQTCDGFVVGLYAAAAKRGLDIHVEGAMSARLLHALNGQCGELLHTLLPHTRKVRVLADDSCDTDWGGRGVYAGFSAGVDSFCTLLTYSRPETPRELRLTGLFYNNVGSHGKGTAGANLYTLRERRIRALAAQAGLPLITVSSNLDALLGVSFQLTHTLRNVAVSLLFQKACGTFLYSSLVHYRDVRARDVSDMSYADPILLPLLRTETEACQSAGSEHTRFDKTRLVAQHALSHTGLDVCVSQSPSATINCSACWKCLRTQLSLELLGVLERYRSVFQLQRYQRCRTLYLASVLQSTDPLLRELREQIVEVPRAARVLSWIAPPALVNALLSAYAISCSRKDAERFDLPVSYRSEAAKSHAFGQLRDAIP